MPECVWEWEMWSVGILCKHLGNRNKDVFFQKGVALKKEETCHSNPCEKFRRNHAMVLEERRNALFAYDTTVSAMGDSGLGGQCDNTEFFILKNWECDIISGNKIKNFVLNR